MLRRTRTSTPAGLRARGSDLQARQQGAARGGLGLLPARGYRSIGSHRGLACCILFFFFVPVLYGVTGTMDHVVSESDFSGVGMSRVPVYEVQLSLNTKRMHVEDSADARAEGARQIPCRVLGLLCRVISGKLRVF